MACCLGKIQPMDWWFDFSNLEKRRGKEIIDPHLEIVVWGTC